MVQPIQHQNNSWLHQNNMINNQKSKSKSKTQSKQQDKVRVYSLKAWIYEDGGGGWCVCIVGDG